MGMKAMWLLILPTTKRCCLRYLYDLCKSRRIIFILKFILQFYEQCGIWKEKNDKLNESESTLSKFEKSALFNKTIEEISERIGLPDIEWEQIKLMWNMCRIDKALALVDSLSPWCAVSFNHSLNF